MRKKIELAEIFVGLQDQMICSLTLNKRALQHPVAKGDATELEWLDMLSTYLPKRYQANKAFVVDHEGSISDQIDIVIFDRHYSPFLFHQNGATYVPAESVYAVIEVKQELNKKYVNYAARKALSVRRLKRTTAPIMEAKGLIRNPKPPSEILAGILSLRGKLTAGVIKNLRSLSKDKHLNLGCSLSGGAFYFDKDEEMVRKSLPQHSLVVFFFKLLSFLQSSGTVTAIEIDRYLENLE